MAVIKKTLFPKNLEKFAVLVDDTQSDSKYFKITELPGTFTGGKNAFLIAGSDFLVPDTKIQIELKDSAGNIIYHEPGEGMINTNISGSTNTSIITEYYEGVSKVVAVYVYPDTAYGPCTLTILGELSEYQDANGVTLPVPLDWENKYNVKWQKQIDVNPSLANTTKIRFYKRPMVSITELLEPIYRIESGSKISSGINQSFAEIKLSQLETFAGDVKRVKVFRTSLGDISDFDLIQDILVESKELLTTFGLSGSVIGNTGTFTSETLKNFWNTGSLNAQLSNNRIESGVRLSGSGNFIYSASLDLKSTNTYELNLDAFYSSSTSSNLGIYLSQVTTSLQNGIEVPITISSSLATLVGTQPTKNLLDTVIPFKIDRDYPSASLYFSQSQGEWHLGNISLRLSQDTAFSPDEVSFVTTMPSVIGNETFNFKFEFYDVNNNYVPVAVTQSATFTGGVNINNTLLLVSASTSQSLAALAAVSSSISGTMTVYSSSASSSITIVSSSVSSSLSSSFGFTSSSIYILSSSVSSSLTLTSGSITLVSSSLVFTSQSLNNSLTTLSSSISSSFANTTSESAYQVYSASQYLDKFIFTDANGKLNQPPTASDPGLYLGSEYLGYFSGSGATGWKTYMDNQGDFYLTSSVPGGGLLAWDSSTATLQINGSINIQGGNAATTSSVATAATNAALSGSNAATAVSNSLAPNIFTSATGLINRPPGVLVGSPSGLYLGSTNLGYYSAGAWKTYMADNGNFFLSGAGSDSLSWSSGVLTINGAINITGGNAATTTQVSTAAGNAVTSGSNAASTAQSNAQSFATTAANNAVSSGSAFASAVDDKVFTNALGRITKTPTPGTTSGLYLGNTIMGFYNGSAWKTYMDNTGLFYLTGSANGNALLWDGSTLTIKGNLSVGSTVPNSVVTGLGSLALSSSVSTGQVSGLGALATRNDITLAYVTNAGSLAGLSSISAAQIDASAVTNAKIAADAVTEGKIAADAVTSGKISANAVVADKIAANAIVADKIAANAITAGKIAASAIEADKIAAGAITAGKIAAGAITADKISVADLSALNASIGGWTINSNAISKTASGKTISLNSADREISLTGLGTTNVKIGTEGIYTLGSAAANTTYIGDGGVMVGGRWSTGEQPDNYITLLVTELSPGVNVARQVIYNSVGNPAYEALGIYSVPTSTNASLKVSQGGANIINGASSNSGYALQLGGTFYCSAAGTFAGDVTANASDKRLKTNIRNIDSPLEKISKINGVYFNWNDKAKELADKDTKTNQVGLIAQEIQKAFPEIVKAAPFDVEFDDENSLPGQNKYKSKSGENYLTIQYEKMVPLLVECIKELKSEIEELKKNKQ
jgi:hypothetical protein